MIEKTMMISGLKKQSYLLAKLIEDLERKPWLDENDFYRCGQQAKLVAGNLRKLRQIKQSYFVNTDLN
jgi:hypothetical protein